jgi:hypothetical protein
MLHVNPTMSSRLEELEQDLQQRRDRAAAEGWLGRVLGVGGRNECLVAAQTTSIGTQIRCSRQRRPGPEEFLLFA